MLNNPRPGLGFASEYQGSSLPFVTSSVANSGVTLQIEFPNVTRYIAFHNLGTAGQNIRVGFTKNGVEGTNYFRVLGNSMMQPHELRVKTLFIRPDGAYSPAFDLIAGLTTISSRDMPVLTGSLWSGVG
jgi:hypothetical protein